jgi:hypothetical protein
LGLFLTSTNEENPLPERVLYFQRNPKEKYARRPAMIDELNKILK